MTKIIRIAPICASLCLFAGFAVAETTPVAETADADALTDTAETTETAAAVDTDTESTAADDKVVERVKITPASASRDALVCRMEKPIGSHIPRRVCRTNWQIDADSAEGRATLRDADLRRRDRSSRVGVGLSMDKYRAGKY